MSSELSRRTLSTSVIRLLRSYVKLIALLPEGNRRASEAQARKSASVLFGLKDPSECKETSALLDVAAHDLTVNVWRLMRAYERSVYKLPPEKQKPEEEVAFNLFLVVLRILKLELSAEEMKIVSLEGRDYDPNYAIEAVNGDEYEDDNGLMVSEMIEPIILKGGKPVWFGKIRVARKGETH